MPLGCIGGRTGAGLPTVVMHPTRIAGGTGSGTAGGTGAGLPTVVMHPTRIAARPFDRRGPFDPVPDGAWRDPVVGFDANP
jgi:hypothetical protein